MLRALVVGTLVCVHGLAISRIGALSPAFSSGARSGPIRLVEGPEERAAQAAARAAVVEARLAAAPEQGFNEEELAALTAASKCLEMCYQGPKAECPKPLLNGVSQRPLTFFNQLRMLDADPVPEAWEAVRSKWPVLSGRSDEELLNALEPIKAVFVDMRSCK
jgi:hypothetical protein